MRPGFRFALLPLLLLPSAASSQVVAPRSTSSASERAAIARARRIVLDTMKALGTPGASITILRNGRLIWSEGFGYADLEQRVPATPRTVFRIGSVSKPLTSVALGLLVEQGKIDLDAPIQRYVPSFPVKRYPITVRQVAGHLAGIRHYLDDEFANQRHYNSVLEGLAIFREDSLLFEPGTQFFYSSYGWNLIAAVIEGASGDSFLHLMQSAVFDRAEMRHTGPEYADSIIPFRARFYTWIDSLHASRNAPYVDNSYKWAGGGFLSTTDDLAHFGELILEGKLLRPETVQLFWTSQHTTDGKATGYGIGWSINQDSTGERRIGHTGGAMGGTATLQIYPDQHLVIAILVNSDRTFISVAPRLAVLFMSGRK